MQPTTKQFCTTFNHLFNTNQRASQKVWMMRIFYAKKRKKKKKAMVGLCFQDDIITYLPIDEWALLEKWKIEYFCKLHAFQNQCTIESTLIQNVQLNEHTFFCVLRCVSLNFTNFSPSFIIIHSFVHSLTCCNRKLKTIFLISDSSLLSS